MASEQFQMLIDLGSAMLTPETTVPELRAFMDQVEDMRTEVEGAVVDVVDEPVHGHWIRHESVSEDADVFLWYHGGGYVSGNPYLMHGMGTWMSQRSGTRMFGPSYGLGPEDPFPQGLDDALRAYEWIIDQVGAERVVVGGDSAGGGLVLALLLRLREEGRPLPRASVTFSPWADLTISGESIETRKQYTYGMSEPMMRRLAEAYLGGADPAHPYASPAFADWSGMPPMHIQVGDCEVLLSDSTTLAENAERAGVEVDLVIWPEMSHVHQVFVGAAPESNEACDRAGDYVKSFLNPSFGS